MKSLGFVTRALAIELIAVGGIAWFASGNLSLWNKPAATADRPLVQIAKSGSSQQRKEFVRSRLERFSSQLRSGANQLVDEALATWFDK